MTLSLTFDHRIVDGAPAARFLQDAGEPARKPEPLADALKGFEGSAKGRGFKKHLPLDVRFHMQTPSCLFCGKVEQ